MPTTNRSMQNTALMFSGGIRKAKQIWTSDQMEISIFRSVLKSCIKEHSERSIFKEMRFVSRVLEQGRKMANWKHARSAEGKELCCKMWRWGVCFRCRCKLSVRSVKEKVIRMLRSVLFVKENGLSWIQRRFKLRYQQGLSIMKKLCFMGRANRIQIRKLVMLYSRLNSRQTPDSLGLVMIFTQICQYPLSSIWLDSLEKFSI